MANDILPIENIQDNAAPATNLAYILSSNRIMARAVCLLFMLIVLTVLFINFILKKFVENDMRVEFTLQGATMVFTGKNLFQKKQFSQAMFLLPSSTAWVNTGIDLEPGKTYTIYASGQVNLSLDKMMEAAQRDAKPAYGWYGPDGGPFIAVTDADAKKRQLLISPDHNIGCLMGCLRGADEGPPDHPADIKIIGHNNSITNLSAERKKLWLTVNDMLLNNIPVDSARQAYLAGSSGVKRIQHEENWQQIVRDQYWDLWFNDNIGEFMIHIEKE